jgi:hypothetical protein
MHDTAGNQRFVSQSILHIREQLANPTPELIDAISSGIGSTDAESIEDKRAQLAAHFDEISKGKELAELVSMQRLHIEESQRRNMVLHRSGTES